MNCAKRERARLVNIHSLRKFQPIQWATLVVSHIHRDVCITLWESVRELWICDEITRSIRLPIKMNLHVFWCLYACLNELILPTVYNSLARCILNERCLFERIVVHFQPIVDVPFVLYTQIRFILSIVSFDYFFYSFLCTPVHRRNQRFIGRK